MTELVKLIIVTFLLVMGMKIIMSKDMILEKLGQWFEKKSKQYRIFDVFHCPWCMSSLFSIFGHFFCIALGYIVVDWSTIFLRWPLVICGSAFVSGNTWNIYETINRIHKRNEEQAYFYSCLNDEYDKEKKKQEEQQ